MSMARAGLERQRHSRKRHRNDAGARTKVAARYRLRNDAPRETRRYGKDYRPGKRCHRTQVQAVAARGGGSMSRSGQPHANLHHREAHHLARDSEHRMKRIYAKLDVHSPRRPRVPRAHAETPRASRQRMPGGLTSSPSQVPAPYEPEQIVNEGGSASTLRHTQAGPISRATARARLLPRFGGSPTARSRLVGGLSRKLRGTRLAC